MRSTFVGEAGSSDLVATTKWTGRTTFDSEAISDAFAE